MKNMKTLRFSILFFSLIGMSAPALPQSKSGAQKRLMKQDHYEKIDFEGLMHRYLSKPAPSQETIEGIYSVSCVITKKAKGFLSGNEKEKTVERKDNYARVAIIEDAIGSKNEFIEISLDEKFTVKYPIVGDFNSLSEGDGFIYKHIEPNGETVSFTFTNEQNDILDGILAEMKGKKTITYKMTYLKVFPKGSEQLTSNQ
jgi:hypothetical protein